MYSCGKVGQGGKNNQEQVVLLGQGCTKKVRYKDGEQETQELGKGKLWYASCVLCGVWGYLSGSLNLIVRTGQLARTFLTSMCQKKKKKPQSRVSCLWLLGKLWTGLIKQHGTICLVSITDGSPRMGMLQ